MPPRGLSHLIPIAGIRAARGPTATISGRVPPDTRYRACFAGILRESRRGLVHHDPTLYAFLYRRNHEDLELHRVEGALREVLDSVVNDREEVVITRAGHEPVVIVSLEDFESLRETAYLMRSPANARRLLDAMERLESGDGEARDLVDAD